MKFLKFILCVIGFVLVAFLAASGLIFPLLFLIAAAYIFKSIFWKIFGPKTST